MVCDSLRLLAAGLKPFGALPRCTLNCTNEEAERYKAPVVI